MLFKNGSGTSLQLRGAILKWALCGAFVFALSLGQARATNISDTFLGWPPDPFVQLDKTWGGWADVTGNLPADYTTLISTRSGIIPGQDLHTFSLSASFLPNTTYVISYYIMVNTPGVSMIQSSSGVRTTIPGASITTTFAEVPAFTINTSGASGLQVLPGGPYSMLHVTDTVTTGNSDITGFSNSFLQQIAIPEPGTLALFGSGILAGATLLRRKIRH
jgi:PEP-CTERM motif